MLDTCAKYNIKVLVDVHAIKDSQNGFDNSGKATEVFWSDESHFEHWPRKAANWMGPWNRATGEYDYMNYDNMDWALEVANNLLLKWGAHSAFYGFEPVNEPWANSNMPALKDFYRKVRKLMQKHAPQATFVFHDAFQYNATVWNDLFLDDDIDKVAMDHHYY